MMKVTPRIALFSAALLGLLVASAGTPQPAEAANLGACGILKSNFSLFAASAIASGSADGLTFNSKSTNPAAGVTCNAGSTTAVIMASPWTTGKTCIFTTTGGDTCNMRGGDGLPVELLQFGVN